MRAREAQQRQELIAVRGVLARAFLQHRTELLPERCVLLRCVFGEPSEQIKGALGERCAHRLHIGVLLQKLARNVERQVARIEHTAHETQVVRQELRGVIHDEHAPHIEFQAPRSVALVEIEGRPSGDIE